MENEIRYFSMFTGVGGFELGLEPQNRGSKSDSNRFNCVGMSEWDKYSSQVLAERFPNIKNWGDCTKINPSELPDFDMLCGGFPCQAFSIAGKRRGFEDTRGTMFFEVARIIKVKRPKLVLLENVKGLLNHNKGETFSVIIQTLEELGYDVQWMVLNSKFFGVPQNRERVFIIGNLRGECRPEILPFRKIGREINELHRYEEVTNTIHARITADSNGTYIESRGSPQMIASVKANHLNQNGRNIHTDGHAFTISQDQNDSCIAIMDLYNHKEHTDRTPTLTEPHHNSIRVTDGFRIRRLTPTECCRLQGFPDDWNASMSDTQRYKQMGNAVTVNVIQALGIKLLEGVVK